jgi:hypothetical protein
MRRVATQHNRPRGDRWLLAGGVASETNILSVLAQLGMRYVVQQGLE